LGQLLDTPRTLPNALLLGSGSLDSAKYFTIIKLLVGPEKFKNKRLKTWKKGQNGYEETELVSGLIIIHPGVCYSLPKDVPFLPLYSSPRPGNQAALQALVASSS
jgi:hypothetical protein